MKYAIALLLIFLSGCQLFETSGSEEIDPDLIGDWYMAVDTPTSFDSPADTQVRGWSILPDGSFQNLGVVDSTGVLAPLSLFHETTILSAKNGVMALEHTGHPDIGFEEVNYQITGDQLVIENSFINTNGTFTRSEIGTKVIPPMPSRLGVSVNGESTQNVNVAHQIPTTFISKRPDQRLYLMAKMDGAYIRINLNAFLGSGTYTIGKEEAEYLIVNSDAVTPFQTIMDDSGTLSIDCDDATMRCTGSFSFTTNNPGNNISANPVLTNGYFDLPFFK